MSPLSFTSNERRCRVCGCTEFNACIDERTGSACHWVQPDLCSACVAPPVDDFEQDEDYVPPSIYTPPSPPLWTTAIAALAGTGLIFALVSLAMLGRT